MCLSKIQLSCYAENKRLGEKGIDKRHGLRGNLMKKQTWIEIIVVLAEMPEIAVTEQDEKLEDYVMGLPEVQEFLLQPDGGSIPYEKEEDILSGFLAEGDLLTGFGVVDHDVYLDIKQGEEKQLSYTFDGAGTQPMRKIIWVYEQRWDGWQNTAAYEAWGDSYVKRTGKHAWFSWVGGLFR